MNVFLKAQQQKWYLYGLAGISFFIGTAIIIYATAIYPWAFSDSTVYIWAARNLAAGLGLVIQNTSGGYDPLIWFPPLYPVLISIPVLLGTDALQAARWINAICFGLLLAISSFAVLRISRSRLLGLAIVVLLAINPGLLKIFSGALSEPLFLVLTLAALVVVSLAAEAPEKDWLWILGGLLAGMAFLTRYLGAAVIVTAILFLVVLKGTWKQRVRYLLMVALPSLVPAGVWFLLTKSPAGSLGGRHFEWSHASLEATGHFFTGLWNEILVWVPYITRGSQVISPQGKLLLGLLILIGVFFGFRRFSQKTSDQKEYKKLSCWIAIWFTFSVFYLAIHLVSYMVIVEKPDTDLRLFSPVFFAWFMILISFLGLIRSYKKAQIPVIVTVMLVLIIYVSYFGKQTIEYIQDMHQNGWGYTSRYWQDSQLLAETSRLDPAVKVYSNDPALILLHHGYFPGYLDFPARVESHSNPSQVTIIVMFYPQAQGVYGDRTEELFDSLDERYQAVYRGTEGGIYKLPGD